MIIKHADVYCPDHRFFRQDIVIREGRILEGSFPPLPGEEVLEADGLYALPGLVDIHFHGCAGHDFCDADPLGLAAMADFEASRGVLAICPATMTLPEDTLLSIMDTAAAHSCGRGADLVGIYLEGPFISGKKAGAQDPAYVCPGSASMVRRLNARSHSLIKIVCAAPEIPENLAMIREITPDIRVSLAHMTASYEEASAAFSAGASQLTHLYNAMPGLHHRAPGPIPAALEAGAAAELIADGIHVHPAMVRLSFSLFGPERIILISDSMRATGLPDGLYSLGGQPVTVSGKRAFLSSDPSVIAGSVTCLYDCLRTCVCEMGIPLTDAVRAASENPARAIGVQKDYGTLSPGSYGNVLLSDRDLNLIAVIQKGQRIHNYGL